MSKERKTCERLPGGKPCDRKAKTVVKGRDVCQRCAKFLKKQRKEYKPCFK